MLFSDGSYVYYMALYRELTDAKTLDKLHWDNKQKVLLKIIGL